ncbi:TBC1 domain family member 5 isoform X1 [Amblyraja radiata]|uniref:TBC1 domain family member 5 isoform X1 n=1 Tax=Amblyraja radiata TaxID=386614 RepID=UPI001402FE7E|nr:TBC1 domain family member 5 isoform X1 [Amblyraja radiata]XP_032906805.1 TBC1 domain family member 5 isoform X1 [Amblyraja radiata]
MLSYSSRISAFETRHPLETDAQETGIDPLQNELVKNDDDGENNENEETKILSEFDNGKYSSYSKEWEDLFEHSNYFARIRLMGINGQLRSSRFRSVCWKLFLEALPEDKKQWLNKVAELRSHYEQIKEIHITNPRKAAGQQDLIVNNPLSQDEGSLWNKFFQDKELRAMIQQDVTRTFPEMQYFQQESVRHILTDILFCYARENEQLLYKQGMHELLAPLVFVLHCDHQAFLHASETANPSEEMKALLNPEFLEHDAYAMFSQLMDTAEPWFSSFEREIRKGKEEMVTAVPFARPQDLGPSLAIVSKVNRIQDQLLKKYDAELYMHLNRLEIAPQIYGIRWVRLLFGREFPLQDLLVIWDTLFADSVTLDLVDYIFLAMVLYIRDVLIASNYQTCLGLLLHYPSIEDVHSFIQKSLFLRDPKNNPRPMNYQFQQNLDYYRARGAEIVNKTRVGAKVAPLNINKVSSSLLNLGRKLINPAILVGGTSGLQNFGTNYSHPSPQPSSQKVMVEHTQQHQQQRMMKSESMPVQLSKGQIVTGDDAKACIPVKTITELPGHSSSHVSASPSTESLPTARDNTASPPHSTAKKDSFFSTISRSRSHSKTMGGRKDTEDELESQVSFLQGQLNDLEAMCKFCAKMMNTHICKIQDVILKENLQKEDEVLVSLAGLKQIKDILKGSLRFNQSQLEAEENEEITIADNHYCTNNRAEGESIKLPQADREMQATVKTEEVTSLTSLNSDGRNSDDYILVSKEDDDLMHEHLSKKLEATGATSEKQQTLRASHASEATGKHTPQSSVFSDPLTGGVLCLPSSNSESSPDDDSSNSKDSDFTIVSPLDI